MKSLNDIDLTTKEGRALMAAIGILTISPEIRMKGETINGRDTTPDDMLAMIEAVVPDFCPQHLIPCPDGSKSGLRPSDDHGWQVQDRPDPGRDVQFGRELEALINKHGIDNDMDTPDFIIRQVLEYALNGFRDGVKNREQWFGHRLTLDGPIRIMSNDDAFVMDARGPGCGDERDWTDAPRCGDVGATTRIPTIEIKPGEGDVQGWEPPNIPTGCQ